MVVVVVVKVVAAVVGVVVVAVVGAMVVVAVVVSLSEGGIGGFVGAGDGRHVMEVDRPTAATRRGPPRVG